MNEYRCQIVIIAAEVHTAHSLAMQLNLYANGPDGRRFKHIHMHAGFPLEFPAVLENIDIGAMDNKSEQKNLTVLVAEINLRAAIPLIQAPRADEPNDGGTAPAGYPVVMEVNSFDAVSLNKIRTYVDGDEIKTEFSR
jgi:hypothetical protein